MREALVILVVLLLLAGLTAYKYRKGIGAFLEFWRMLRSVREQTRPRGKQIPEEPMGAGPLVSCPRCGKWVTEDEAIRLGRSTFYCSTNCLQASTKSG